MQGIKKNINSDNYTLDYISNELNKAIEKTNAMRTCKNTNKEYIMVHKHVFFNLLNQTIWGKSRCTDCIKATILGPKYAGRLFNCFDTEESNMYHTNCPNQTFGEPKILKDALFEVQLKIDYHQEMDRLTKLKAGKENEKG